MSVDVIILVRTIWKLSQHNASPMMNVYITMTPASDDAKYDESPEISLYWPLWSKLVSVLWREWWMSELLLPDWFKGDCIICGRWHPAFLKSSLQSFSLCLSLQPSLRVAPSLWLAGCQPLPFSEATALPFMPQLFLNETFTLETFITHTDTHTHLHYSCVIYWLS